MVVHSFGNITYLLHHLLDHVEQSLRQGKSKLVGSLKLQLMRIRKHRSRFQYKVDNCARIQLDTLPSLEHDHGLSDVGHFVGRCKCPLHLSYTCLARLLHSLRLPRCHGCLP